MASNIRHFSSEFDLDGILVDVFPHIMVDWLAGNLDFAKSIFGDEFGDDSIPHKFQHSGH